MRFHTFIALAATLFLSAGSAQAAPLIYPTGVTQYDPSKAANGYMLIGGHWGPTNSADAYAYVKKNEKGNWVSIPSSERRLIDMNGNVVHVWKNAPGDRFRLLPDGNLLTLDQTGKRVVEYDWDGNVVWEYKTNLGPHHDVHRLPNGNTLILTFENVPVEKLDKVKDYQDQWFGTVKRRDTLLIGDSIIEVTPEKKIVWQWNSSDHLDLNLFNPMRPVSDWTHGNTISVLPENKWYDAGDKRFKPGNILYNPRHFDEVQLIDRESGDIVWTWKTKKLGGLTNAHEPNMIPKGRPGEGNILIFDNGLFPKTVAHAGKSVLHEFDPSSGEVVWSYVPNRVVRLFSTVMSTVSKLPNGNVLTSEDSIGRTIQIRPDAGHPEGGEIVWEYVHDGGLDRPSWYPYDYCPQMKTLPAPSEKKVSPVEPATWSILPDELRTEDNFVKINR